jgi:hypothetical protein
MEVRVEKKTTKKRKFNVSSHKTLTLVQCWLTQDQAPDEKTHHSGPLFHQAFQSDPHVN